MKGDDTEGNDKTSWLCVQDRDQPGGNRPIFVSAVVPMRFNLMAYPSVKTKGETMSDQEMITSNDQVQFVAGARQGYLFYLQGEEGKKHSPRALYDFLMNILIDTTHASVWNAGYIAGWFTALSQDGNTVSLSALAQDASVLLQRVQAHVDMKEEEGQG
jgi:hypothetical protein